MSDFKAKMHRNPILAGALSQTSSGPPRGLEDLDDPPDLLAKGA